LLGDVAENGLWWTGGQGGQDDRLPVRIPSRRGENGPSFISRGSPHLDWGELKDWYSSVINCGQAWLSIYDEIVKNNPSLVASDSKLEELEEHILKAQDHSQRTLLRATETILKRPGRPITHPSDLRFLLIILANPLFRPSYKPFAGKFKHPDGLLSRAGEGTPQSSGIASGRHSGIVKRILGLISNAPNDCHSHLVSWLARYPESQFIRTKDLVGSFLTYRCMRQSEKRQEVQVDIIDALIPSMSADTTPASLHAALGHASGSSKKSKQRQKKNLYHDDWQVKAAAQVMALIFTANNAVHARRSIPGPSPASRMDKAGSTISSGVQTRGQILPTSDFYTTLLDDSDLVADFEAWEHQRGNFSFCQYPFLLSIWAKIQILEYDARRQMQSKARDAFFDSIVGRRAVEQYLVLNVRRDCLVEDSLNSVSAVIGSGSEDIKKGLRIAFKGEEGVDAGGLRKEWFLLLVRELFNPDHGT
jgi:E3 ubiquitin-protein ligase HECTD2